MDKAPAYGAGDSGFESLRRLIIFLWLLAIYMYMNVHHYEISCYTKHAPDFINL